METTAIREKLHKYIDVADERKIEAMYIMLEDEIASYDYNTDEIKLFHKRRNKHLNQESVCYTPDEALNLIRSVKNQHDL